MRKSYLFIAIVVSLLLVGCNHTEDSTINENTEPTIVYPSRMTYSLRELTKEAEIIAELTITELVEVIEVEHHEFFTQAHSIYKATVNDYLHNELGYDDEIEVLQVGGPNWRYSDDPLLEIGETYLLFLDNREDPNLGTNLVMTGGPTGRFNKIDDVYVRQLGHTSEGSLSRLTIQDLGNAINDVSEEINIDLSILEE